MIETLKNIFVFIKEWSDVILIFAGFSAFLIYHLQKKDRKRAAATLLKSQIDFIESAIKYMLSFEQLNGMIVYKTPMILSRNAWEESKYCLVKTMDTTDVRLLEEFYAQVEQIEKSRQDLCNRLVCSWEHKDQILQENFFVTVKENTTEQSDEVFSKFCKDSVMFNPRLPIDILSHNLSTFKFLSGTTAYEKITKLSYYK